MLEGSDILSQSTTYVLYDVYDVSHRTTLMLRDNLTCDYSMSHKRVFIQLNILVNVHTESIEQRTCNRAQVIMIWRAPGK
jgi:hypothetical protein